MLRDVSRLPWAADGCPWVGKLRTVLPFTNRDVIRDSAVRVGVADNGATFHPVGE
jgi:hypothetical protein